MVETYGRSMVKLMNIIFKKNRTIFLEWKTNVTNQMLKKWEKNCSKYYRKVTLVNSIQKHKSQIKANKLFLSASYKVIGFNSPALLRLVDSTG